MNSLTYKAFLSDFIGQLSNRKYVFLFDNAPYHKSSTIKDYLAKFSLNIKFEFLPAYSPKLNPTETCWKIIRANVRNLSYFQNPDVCKKVLKSFPMNILLC